MSPRAIAVASLLAAAAAAASPAAALDLTGTWTGDDSSTYTIQQRGSAVSWNGRSDNGTSWNHDFTGSYDEGTGNVSGEFEDRPGYDVFQSGRVTVHVDDACRMSFVSATTGWGTRVWTKQGCTAAQDPQKPVRGVVPLESVANGCGGDFGEYALQMQNYVADTSTFFDGPSAESFTVNFRPACNQHDAGYAGVKVVDPINGNRVRNYRTWSRLRVDDKFEADLETMCARQIPSSAKVARRKCFGTGGAASIGAGQRYEVVRQYGMHFFDADPGQPGTQRRGPRRNN